MYRIPRVFSGFSDLWAAESTRHGGVSPAPYHSLNLGINTADDPENVAENRRRLALAIGYPPEQLAWSKQVHGTAIWYARHAGGVEGYDALITDVPGIVLGVGVADCAAILVYDARRRAIAAIHAGWKGTAGGIVAATLAEMAQRFGTNGADCTAFISTCIDECSFEVGDEVAAQFADPFRNFDPERGKYCVDLKRANHAQLCAFGIPEMQIEISPFSTVLHPADYFSHRREGGITGRMLAVIGLR